MIIMGVSKKKTKKTTERKVLSSIENKSKSKASQETTSHVHNFDAIETHTQFFESQNLQLNDNTILETSQTQVVQLFDTDLVDEMFNLVENNRANAIFDENCYFKVNQYSLTKRMLDDLLNGSKLCDIVSLYNLKIKYLIYNSKFLNLKIIEAYISCIMHRNCYLIASQTITNILLKKENDSLTRVDFSNYDTLIAPIHVNNNHWNLFFVSVKKQAFMIIDPYGLKDSFFIGQSLINWT